MAQASDETRLDQLWRAVAESDAEQDWLRFYEGFATARLIVPLAERAAGEQARLKTLTLESGEIVPAFDTEARFADFIREPADFLTVTGVLLARSLSAQGISVALNPIVSTAETVLDPQMLSWIAEHAGAEVTVEPSSGPTELAPPPEPGPELLDALGRRFAEMTGTVVEAWLLATKASRGRDAFLCVLLLAPEAEALADDIAREITRLGQIRAARPFGVAVARPDARMLVAARHFGIGLVVPSAA